jgi:LysR family transcriptional regulator, glycine cleavage system transcriptional activator
MSETHLSQGPKPRHAMQGGQRGLPFAALRAFEAAARVLSLRDAAAEIGLSPSAVSHHVRNLEGMLGVRLFERLARGVALTPAGRALAADLSPAFSAIAQAYTKAGNAVLNLRLSAAPLFASRYILPNIDALNTLRPGVSFSVESTLERSDVSKDPRSMALYFGPEPAGVQAIQVAASGSLVVASPSLGKTIAKDTRALAKATLLTITRRSSHWAALFKALEIDGPRREVFFDSIEGVLHAAEAGVGVALLPTLVCEESVRAGRLIQVHPDALDNGWRYWLAAAPDSPAAKQLTTVARWLRSQINAAH